MMIGPYADRMPGVEICRALDRARVWHDIRIFGHYCPGM